MERHTILLIGLASALSALAQPITNPQIGKAYYLLNTEGQYMTWTDTSLQTKAADTDEHQVIYFEPVTDDEGYYNIRFEGVDGYLAGDKSNGWTAVISANASSDLAKFAILTSSYDDTYINLKCKGVKRGGGMLGQDPGSSGIYTDKSDGSLSIWDIIEVDTGDKPALESLAIDRDQLQLGIYEGQQLTAIFNPAEAQSRVKWTSSDDSIVSVTSNGVVRGLRGGNATVTATCGDKSAHCVVTVTAIDRYPDNNLSDDDIRKYGHNGYKLVFAEEFSTDGDPDYEIWDLEDGYSIRNNEDQYYVNPNSDNGIKWGVRNAYIKDGVLVIEARNDSLPNPSWNRFSSKPKYYPFSSASLKTKGAWDGGYSWMFGIYEIRAKITAETGLWPAIWSTGMQYEWPQGGEIDLMEYYGDRLHANVCWGNGVRWGGKWNSKTVHLNTLPDDWDQHYHVWKMVWDYDRMQLWVDDILINDIDLNTTVNANPHTDWYNEDGVNPFRDVRQIGWLNLALGGNNGGSLKHTTFPSYYLIDYFRVYQRIGSDGKAIYHVDEEISDPKWQNPTGIESVRVESEWSGITECYDLNGRKICDMDNHNGFCIVKQGCKVNKVWLTH